ncbi:hypothetical protein RF55_13297 [Lasius niger]|uniref:Uncharacterized protein n=1 Tax=Lasius niger TaxID=67767 RepID=A0A0J7KAY9_LASNI|nr:hypothetical protein RF55_13297 [Lasius niger]
MGPPVQAATSQGGKRRRRVKWSPDLQTAELRGCTVSLERMIFARFDPDDGSEPTFGQETEDDILNPDVTDGEVDMRATQRFRREIEMMEKGSTREAKRAREERRQRRSQLKSQALGSDSESDLGRNEDVVERVRSKSKSRSPITVRHSPPVGETPNVDVVSVVRNATSSQSPQTCVAPSAEEADYVGLSEALERLNKARREELRVREEENILNPDFLPASVKWERKFSDAETYLDSVQGFSAVELETKAKKVLALVELSVAYTPVLEDRATSPITDWLKGMKESSAQTEEHPRSDWTAVTGKRSRMEVDKPSKDQHDPPAKRGKRRMELLQTDPRKRKPEEAKDHKKDPMKEGNKQTPIGTNDPLGEKPKKRRRKGKGKRGRGKVPNPPRHPRSAAVTLAIPEGGSLTYRDVLVKAREKISLTNLKISESRVRRTMTGAILIEIPDKEAPQKADRLHDESIGK